MLHKADFAIGDIVGDYGAVIGEIPNGYASISTTVAVAGQASASGIQDIETIGVNKRLYLQMISREHGITEMELSVEIIINLLSQIM